VLGGKSKQEVAEMSTFC